MKNNIIAVLILFVFFSCTTKQEESAEIQYLSGTGYGDTVEWDFFCTGGRKSGEWTKIAVPSHWEQEGFGTYNYGYDKKTDRAEEEGLYKKSFSVPADWKERKINIVFEGSMTDTEVKINGKVVGPVHQGSFYRFKYDISSFLNFGKENLLEVKVSKVSENYSVNAAERFADFWVFGGIYRPVFLEALPKKHIEHFAIDANADGTISADIDLINASDGDKVILEVFDLNQKKVASFKDVIENSELRNKRVSGKISGVKTWSPEFPNLYNIKISLKDSEGKGCFIVEYRIGFRTVELKESDGIYLNGEKIKFKGVCRHSHWPESGRTTNKEISILDAKLMKEMNMNAVRMSHYPPDKHFLYVCDSLGIMVINELTGWGDAYDTIIGARVVQEMIKRDVNHPSIVLWSNGNEEGWNLDLIQYFDNMDPQKRPTILPSVIFRGTDTQHYEDFDYGNGIHHRGRDVVFPTEFLHGQFDGGLGAGLEDFWHQMDDNPLCAGGFLWSFADEAIVRTDLNDSIDHDRNHAADGIVGPHREKEGSFYTIKELWSPIFFERRYITPEFDGTFKIENRYHYTNLNQCELFYEYVDLASPTQTDSKTLFQGKIDIDDIAPGMKGEISVNLPRGWESSDVLYITAIDPHGMEIFKWSWPVKLSSQVAEDIVKNSNSKRDNSISETDSFYILSSDEVKIYFDKNTGLLNKVEKGGKIIPFGNGPRLVEGDPLFEGVDVSKKNNEIILDLKFTHGRDFYTGNYKSLKWTLLENGWLKMESQFWPTDSTYYIGLTFDLPEENVKSLRFKGAGPYRVWKNRLKGGVFNVWGKEYNNTITAEDYNYPEFKGYYKDFYWAQFNLTENSFTVLTASNDIFLRILTPESAPTRYNDKSFPPFPEGDISFLHGISAIGTKFKGAERLGPMSQKNYFKHYRHFYKELTLYFDFS